MTVRPVSHAVGHAVAERVGAVSLADGDDLAEQDLMSGSQPIPPEKLVTLANWQDPPGNRWSFQHVRELVPTAVIERDPSRTWELARAECSLDGLTFTSSGREWSVEQFLESSETDGFLVIHRGTIVTERYFNHLSEDATHLCQSVSKSLTAAVAGCLVGRGDLDPHSTLVAILPELAGTSLADATVQQLLDMTTGTRFSEDYDDPDADVRRFEQVYQWRPRSGAQLPDDALAYFATLGNEREHGAEFRYRSVLTDVMAWVIERAGGGRFHEVVARELWGPMGAEFDAEVTVDAKGNAMADGGFCVTLRDLGRVGLLYLNGGEARGRRVVPAGWVQDTINGTPESRAVFARSSESRLFPATMHYRNYWWIYDRSQPLFYAAGIYGQSLYVHGPTQTVLAKFSTWPTPLSEVKQAAVRDATVAIGEHLERERASS